MIRCGMWMAMVCAGLMGSAQADPLPRAASVSVCTDQYLMTLASPEQVAAVSWQANTARSPVRHLAIGYPVLRGAAEEMLAVEADMVIFDTYGHPQTAARMEELGTRVVRLGDPVSFEDVEVEIRRVADELGVSQRGAELAAELQIRREAVQAFSSIQSHRPRALYITPGGGGAGGNTYIDEVFQLAGFDNLQAELGMNGWGRVPLELLVDNPPDVLVLSFFETADPSLLDGFGRHPLFRQLVEETPVIMIPAAPWVCAGPYMMEAAEQLASERARLFPVAIAGAGQ